jgi:hypothetical protein
MLAYDPVVVKTINEAAAQFPGSVHPLNNPPNSILRVLLCIACTAVLAWAIWQSKRQAKQRAPRAERNPQALAVKNSSPRPVVDSQPGAI